MHPLTLTLFHHFMPKIDFPIFPHSDSSFSSQTEKVKSQSSHLRLSASSDRQIQLRYTEYVLGVLHATTVDY